MDDLYCEILVDSIDPDGNSVTYTFDWTVDSSTYIGNPTTTLYSGDTISAQTVAAGAKLYIGTDGMLTTTAGSAGKVVGHALGSVDSTSSGVLFKLEL